MVEGLGEFIARIYKQRMLTVLMKCLAAMTPKRTVEVRKYESLGSR